MVCCVCGRWAQPDRETGYDADDVCPDCDAPCCWWCAGTLNHLKADGYCSPQCEAAAENENDLDGLAS